MPGTVYIIGFVLLVALFIVIIISGYKHTRVVDTKRHVVDNDPTPFESYQNIVLANGNSLVQQRQTTLWDIENENHAIYDRERYRRDLSNIVESPSPPHVLVQYNNNHVNKLVDLLNRYAPSCDIIGVSDLSEFDKSENGNGTFSNIKLCPKMIELHTSLEFAAMNRNHFKISTHPDSIIYYSSEPVTIDEKEYYMLTDGKKYTSDSYYEDATLLMIRVIRVVDDREFYYAHFRQRYKRSFVNRESYLQVLRCINTIVERHSDLPIIFTGTLNVEFDQDSLQRYFPYHHVCDFRNNETFINNDERIANDFVIVSRSLYDRIDYCAEFTDTYNRNEHSLIVKCALYKTHNRPGVYNLSNVTDGTTIVVKSNKSINLFDGLTTTDTMARIVQSRNTLIQPTAPLVSVTTDDYDSADTLESHLPKITTPSSSLHADA
ncbi:MAG: hypothetical protein ACRYE7_02800, partial [Janthinobacterium lividum]